MARNLILEVISVLQWHCFYYVQRLSRLLILYYCTNGIYYVKNIARRTAWFNNISECCKIQIYMYLLPSQFLVAIKSTKYYVYVDENYTLYQSTFFHAHVINVLQRRWRYKYIIWESKAVALQASKWSCWYLILHRIPLNNDETLD